MSKYRALIDALEAGPTDGPWLKENGTRITAPNGWMLASAFFTETMPDASEGREPGESWLDARNRLEPERARINAKTEANAAYIAAANPATIRALLADLERAEKDAERYQELKKRFRVMSLDMGGNHTWVLASSGWLKGPSMDEAVDALAQMAGG